MKGTVCTEPVSFPLEGQGREGVDGGVVYKQAGCSDHRWYHFNIIFPNQIQGWKVPINIPTEFLINPTLLLCRISDGFAETKANPEVSCIYGDSQSRISTKLETLKLIDVVPSFTPVYNFLSNSGKITPDVRDCPLSHWGLGKGNPVMQ